MLDAADDVVVGMVTTRKFGRRLRCVYRLSLEISVATVRGSEAVEAARKFHVVDFC